MAEEARRRPDLRPRLQHGVADRGREGRQPIRPRSRSWSPTAPMPPGSRMRARQGIATAVVDHTPLRQGPRGLRARLAARARRSTASSSSASPASCGCSRRGSCSAGRGGCSTSTLPCCRRSRASHPRARACAGVKIHGATVHFVVAGNGFRPDHRAGRGAGARRRHRRDARRARARGRAPHLSAGAAAGRRRPSRESCSSTAFSDDASDPTNKNPRRLAGGYGYYSVAGSTGLPSRQDTLRFSADVLPRLVTSSYSTV